MVNPEAQDGVSLQASPTVSLALPLTVSYQWLRRFTLHPLREPFPSPTNGLRVTPNRDSSVIK